MRAERMEVLTHGLVAGVVGYAAVVVFYAIWNALQGRSLVWLREPLRDQLPTWSVFVVTALALGAMSLYLLAAHPQLQRKLRTYEEDT